MPRITRGQFVTICYPRATTLCFACCCSPCHPNWLLFWKDCWWQPASLIKAFFHSDFWTLVSLFLPMLFWLQRHSPQLQIMTVAYTPHVSVSQGPGCVRRYWPCLPSEEPVPNPVDPNTCPCADDANAVRCMESGLVTIIRRVGNTTSVRRIIKRKRDVLWIPNANHLLPITNCQSLVPHR